MKDVFKWGAGAANDVAKTAKKTWKAIKKY